TSPTSPDSATLATSVSLSSPSTTCGSQKIASPSPNSTTGRVRRRRIAPRDATGTSGASSALHHRQKRGKPARCAALRACCRKLLSACAIRFVVTVLVGHRKEAAIAFLPFQKAQQPPPVSLAHDRFPRKGHAIGHRHLGTNPPEVQRRANDTRNRKRRRRQFGRQCIATLGDVGVDDLGRRAGNGQQQRSRGKGGGEARHPSGGGEQCGGW